MVEPGGHSDVANDGERQEDGVNAPAPATNAGNAAAQQASAENPSNDHYQDGIVIWQNPETAKVPFLLKFNNNTQIRYLNTLDSETTFTDHLGVVRDVHRRNDITVNRLSGRVASDCAETGLASNVNDVMMRAAKSSMRTPCLNMSILRQVQQETGVIEQREHPAHRAEPPVAESSYRIPRRVCENGSKVTGRDTAPWNSAATPIDAGGFRPS